MSRLSPLSLTEEELFEKLISILKEQQYSKAEIEQVFNAYYLAKEAHTGQKRKSGDHYIIHPLHVAIILANLSVDVQTLVGGLLHDVIEDTTVTKENLIKEFSEEVYHLVEGVTKLSKFTFVSERQEQAENFRKMFLAIAKDVRVVLIKLADRMHNMQTLEYLSEDKQKETARETMEIFAPLANRFGLNYFKWRLEDLAFKYLEPESYTKISSLVDENRTYRESYLTRLKESLDEKIREHKINAEVTGRVKHFHSIHNKIQRVGTDEIFDLLAIRVIVEKERYCYEVLGIVHDLFQPLPGRFKDYIALPKSNMYQSLHTTVIGPEKRLVEIQIRTKDMHNIAELGIAAHWKYKESGQSVNALSQYDARLSSLRQKIIEMQNEISDADEYKRAVEIDMFTDEIFIFTPKGDVFCMPRGSTPVDFAYLVHTEIGDHCVGAKVNERISPLSHTLKNGDIVQIITNKSSTPSMDWLNFVKSNSTKSKIKHWFKKHKRDEYIHDGQTIASETLGKNTYDDLFKTGIFQTLSEQSGLNSEDEFFFRMGTGEISSSQLTGRLKTLGYLKSKEKEEESAEELIPEKPIRKKRFAKGSIAELKSYVHTFAKCCQPIPPEEIKGVISVGRGIVIHRSDCQNIIDVEKKRLIDISWDGTDPKSQKFAITLEIECVDRIGVTRDILDKLANEKINVLDVRGSSNKSKQVAGLKLSIEVGSQDSFQHIMKILSAMSDILHVQRYTAAKQRKRNIS